jgi:hypothetical protein
MMLPTHVLMGMLLALPVAVLAPETASWAIIAGAAGGLVPDLDMYVGHRKTLHYPVIYAVIAGGLTLLAVVFPSVPTVALAIAAVAAAVHCIADVLGGGLELRPWEATSDRAVYDHVRGTWIPPRRVIPYDGAPADLVLSVVLAVPLLVTLEGYATVLIGAVLAVATVYAALRRVLPVLAVRLVGHLPASLRMRLPARYLDGHHA